MEDVYEQPDTIQDSNDETIPKIIFIVPYRDRENDKRFFELHMSNVLEDYDVSSYRILYIHQKDTRNFNRGAMKNIGFLYVKSIYPTNYHNITLVFNDVDTIPTKKNLFSYNTEKGIIKHFYGHKHTLGGIFSIKAADFEKIEGFPNFWAWGYEDNAIYRRATIANIEVDRSIFYPIDSKIIIRLTSSTLRQTNRAEYEHYLEEINKNKVTDGISTISQLEYTFDPTTNMVNVTNFITSYTQQQQYNTLYDIKNGSRPYDTPKPRRATGKHLGFLM